MVRIQRVLIADPVHEVCADLLTGHGIRVDTRHGISQQDLVSVIKDYDCVVVRSETKITKEVLESGRGRLRLVGRAGAGIDNINIQSATDNRVIVLNTPGGNSISACELTCAHLLSLARHIPLGDATMKAGKWERAKLKGVELYGKTLAIVGLGRVGREVAVRMGAFGMNLIGYDPCLTQEYAQSFGVTLLPLEEIWPIADYITLHTPLIPQTKNLINGRVLSSCKKGVRLVNAARGGLIDEGALLEALETGHCSGAALDVFSQEPPSSSETLLNKLISHPNVIATPHLGASTVEAQKRVAEEIAEQIIALDNPSSKYKISGAVNCRLIEGLVELGDWFKVTLRLGALLTRFDNPTQQVEVCSCEGLAGSVIREALCLSLVRQDKEDASPLDILETEPSPRIILAQSQSLTPNSIQAIVKSTNSLHTLIVELKEGEGWLVSVDEAKFSPGVLLTETTLLLQTRAVPNSDQLIELSESGALVASGDGACSWIALQTDKPSPQINNLRLKAF